MKKVITVFDGSHFSETAVNFINQYPGEKKPLLVGVFLSADDYSNEFGYSISMAGTIAPVIDDVKKIAENIKRFRRLCEENYLEYKIHNDSGEEALENLRRETIFADLLIINSEKFYRTADEDQPGPHMKNVLQNTECPVLLLPEHFNFPKKIVIAYDGSKASAYAIKQFSYVFPELRGNEAILAYASTSDEEIPERSLIEELSSCHFPNVMIHKLEFSPRKYFNTWLTDRKDAILVAGGYSRSGISSVFHKNFLSEIISDHNMPVFIAHK